jgi:hypothetical protein
MDPSGPREKANGRQETLSASQTTKLKPKQGLSGPPALLPRGRRKPTMARDRPIRPDGRPRRGSTRVGDQAGSLDPGNGAGFVVLRAVPADLRPESRGQRIWFW